MSDDPSRELFEDLPILRELRDRLELCIGAQRWSRPALHRPRWGRRRSRLLIVLLALGLAGGTAYAAIALTHRSASLSGAAPSLPFPWRGTLAGWRYNIELVPTAEAGKVGWCEGTFYARAGESAGFGESSCPNPPPTVDAPLFAQAGTSGPGIWDVLTAPNVTAVRIAGVGTVLTRADPRLPYGYRAAVVELRTALRSASPSLTALDRAGHVIPVATRPAAIGMPTRRWRASTPTRGICSIHTRPGSGVRALGGTVVTRMVPTRGIVGHAFFACVNAQVSVDGAREDRVLAALLLDAAHPGRVLAPLPDMQPVSGEPGILDRHGPFPRSRRRLRRTGRLDQSGNVPDSPFGGLSARRVGDAWLVVEGGSGLAERLQAIKGLTATLLVKRAR